MRQQKLKVLVAYKGLLCSLTGCTNEEVELAAGSTVKELLEELSLRHGDAFREAVLPGGSRPLMALVAVDGASAGLTDVVTEGARVLLVKSIGGGWTAESRGMVRAKKEERGICSL